MSRPTPKYIAIEVQIREDMQVNDDGQKLPLCQYDMWRGTIDLSTNKIIGWPQGIEDNVYDKVSDCGSYTLLDENKNVICSLENDYVPTGCVPNGGEDYIDLEVDVNGVVTNMIENPNFDEFYVQDDEY